MADDDRRVLATPAKRFFVSMLVKDIELIPAIVDLVDNSIDGAKRLRPESADDRFARLTVELVVAPDHFSVADNCGGIDVATARQYAFRFGRPEEWIGPPGEVGQFGVGMKRALFKIGTRFIVESAAATSRFLLPISVSDWIADQSPDWSFEFAQVDEPIEVPDDQRGTRIEVTELHSAVAEVFASERFLARLRAEIELRHMRALQQGLTVRLNGESLQPAHLVLLSSSDFSPLVKRSDIPANGRSVHMDLYAGLDRANDQDDDDTDDAEKYRAPGDAGWYLFCNDRLLLARDKSRLTGWGEAAAAYHPQYRQFRGYVFLAGDASDMPWTTTKTAVDEDSSVLRAVQAEMFDALQKVIVVINRLKAERQQRPPEERPAVSAMSSAPRVALTDLQVSTFVRVPPQPPRQIATSSVKWIRYSVENSDYNKVAAELGVNSPADVGRGTFRFYLETQVAD